MVNIEKLSKIGFFILGINIFYACSEMENSSLMKKREQKIYFEDGFELLELEEDTLKRGKEEIYQNDLAAIDELSKGNEPTKLFSIVVSEQYLVQSVELNERDVEIGCLKQELFKEREHNAILLEKFNEQRSLISDEMNGRDSQIACLKQELLAEKKVVCSLDMKLQESINKVKTVEILFSIYVPEARVSPLSLKLIDRGIKNMGEIKALESLVALEELDLYNNRIMEISDLDSLIKLKKLYLWSNEIAEINGLGNLVSLRELSLANNKITEMKGLDNLVFLQKLYLDNNMISEVKGLRNLVALQYLDLSKNKIIELKIEELEKNTEIDNIILSEEFIEDKSILLEFFGGKLKLK